MKLLVSSLIIFFVYACSPSPTVTPQQPPATNPPTTPPVTPPGPSDFTVDGKWECLIDGVTYAGTIDTGFIYPVLGSSDTAVVFTGISTDKKFHIQGRVWVNRKWVPSGVFSNNNTVAFNFEKDWNTKYSNQYTLSSDNITINVQGFNSTKFKAAFSGQLWEGSKSHIVTGGKLSFELNKGSGEFHKYYLKTTGSVYYGPVRAKMRSHILELYGNSYNGFEEELAIKILTGGTVTPGVYKGNVYAASLSYYVPSYYPLVLNIPAQGDLTITITAVTGDLIEGTIAGVNILESYFKCRIEDYTPESTTAYQFQFMTESAQYKFEKYAGVCNKAVLFTENNNYFLRIKGNAEFNNGDFTLQVRSDSPIGISKYPETIMIGSKRIDSLVYKYKTAYPLKVYFASGEGPWQVIIDTLNAGMVSGRFGWLNSNNSFTYKGSFRAPF